MITSFLARFGQAKAAQLGQSLIQTIVRFDPETASEAQINEFEGQLNNLTQRVAVLRREYNEEKTESDAARAKYNKYLAAAENLKAQLDDPANAAKHADLEKSLTALLATLEPLLAEVEREEKETEEAQSFLKEFEDAASQMAEKLVSARQQLKSAQHEMESASLAKERSASRAEHATVLAGIRQHSDSLGTALTAMQDAARKDRDEAAGSDVKAGLLTKFAPTSVESDPLIREALGTADGEAPAPESLSDRLAALQNRSK